MDHVTASLQADRLQRTADGELQSGPMVKLMNEASELSEAAALATVAKAKAANADKRDVEGLKASFEAMLTANSKLLHKAMDSEKSLDQLDGSSTHGTSSTDSESSQTRKVTPLLRASRKHPDGDLTELLSQDLDAFPTTPTTESSLVHDCQPIKPRPTNGVSGNGRVCHR
jgi:hypothetical protein